MLSLKIFLITGIALSVFFLLGGLPTTSHSAILWDLLISVELEKNPVLFEERPVIFGTVKDHAGKPVSDAEVTIRLEKDAITLITNSTGDFRYEYKISKNPGRYTINLMAIKDDKKGLAQTEFHVKGPNEESSFYAFSLGWGESARYLNSDPEYFKDDPVGMSLYNYYKERYAEYLEKEAKQKELERHQYYLDEQRKISKELQQQIIEQENPGVGIYAGWKYDRFVDNLDLSVKEIIVDQLNYTVNVFTEAQKAMSVILENGGTFEEARLAYFERAATSRDLMESLTSANVFEASKGNNSNTELPSNASLEAMNYGNATNYHADGYDDGEEEDGVGNLMLDINGTAVEVGMSGTTIFLNVNGTLVELLINGTDISQVSNP